MFSVLFLYCGSIALLLAADAWYVDWPSFKEAILSREIR